MAKTIVIPAKEGIFTGQHHVISDPIRNPHHDKPEVAPFPPPDKPDFTVPASRQTETQRFTTKKHNNYRVNMDFVA